MTASKNSARLLNYLQTADMLGVSDRTIFTLMKTGKLKAVRIGRSVRFDRRDIDKFISNAKGNTEGAAQ